jgi:hypothetical protein
VKDGQAAAPLEDGVHQCTEKREYLYMAPKLLLEENALESEDVIALTKPQQFHFDLNLDNA